MTYLRRILAVRRLRKLMKPDAAYWHRWYAHIPPERRERRRERYEAVLREIV